MQAQTLARDRDQRSSGWRVAFESSGTWVWIGEWRSVSTPPGITDLADVRPPEAPNARTQWAFEVFGGRVLSLLVRLLGEPDEAETLAQETFCRLMQSDATFADAVSMRAWLFRVARNLVLDHHKKHRPRLLGREPDAEDPLDAMPAPAVDDVEARDQARAMRGALGELPALYRTTLVLRYLEELSYEEMAEIEGVSQSALRTRVQKGIEMLRGSLGLDPSQTKASGRRFPKAQ